MFKIKTMKTIEIFQQCEEFAEDHGLEFVGKDYKKGEVPEGFYDPKYPEDGITLGFKTKQTSDDILDVVPRKRIYRKLKSGVVSVYDYPKRRPQLGAFVFLPNKRAEELDITALSIIVFRIYDQMKPLIPGATPVEAKI